MNGNANGLGDGLSRRNFFKAAVAIGGTNALSACLERESVDVPEGGGELPDRQHAWNDYLRADDHGNVLTPYHHALLLLDYTGDASDTEDDRATVEDAFSSLERAYEWSHEGLVFTVGYSPYYFDRFDETPGVELPEPEPMAAFENPDLDTADAVVHLTSDHASVVLEAEEALLGERERANGVEIDADLTSVFEKVERRTGFVGEGLPAEHQDVGGVPENKPVPDDSPLYMGFKSGFEESQATEDDVTLGDEAGAFAGGTTQHVSHLHLNLEQWYGQDSRYQRVAKMFCPVHAEEERVEGVGENLGAASGTEDCPEPMESARGDTATVGHAQKARSAREDGRPPLLRRDFDSTDPGPFDSAKRGRAGIHFVALQDDIEKFVRVREAMNADEVVSESTVGPKHNNGILQYIITRSRGNYLVPPRSLRALPPASP
ncbi:MAG: Tat pathway signal protein [Halobacteriales archaeon]|nr:Tat pathway signal protein [Halobacteriales archaeon]